MGIGILESDADQAPKGPGLNFRQKLVVLTLDVAIIAELCYGMFKANLAPDTFTSTFVKSFLILAVPTLILGLSALRLFRTKPAEATA